MHYIVPEWPVSARIHAYSTTRLEGNSAAPYDSFNVGDHVGDDPHAVKKNRLALLKDLALPSEPFWLTQVHGTDILNIDKKIMESPQADGSITTQLGKVCVVMTADCLPVLLTDKAGSTVAALHAGWKGLANGILEKGAQLFSTSPENILAWLGPAISVAHYEVGEEVRQVFVGHDADAEKAFHASSREGHWYMNLYQLARQRLQSVGIQAIYGGNFCTYADKPFFSYRRDKTTGRMATLIWIQ